jgi:UDP-N-acetylglucosamine 2-epimerase
MPEEVNRIVADHLAHWLFAPTPTAVENLRAEGIVEGVHLVGDLMQDLAARVGREVAGADALAAASRQLADAVPGLDLRPGGYLFATVHRAENRLPAALRSWMALLDRVARPDRPVVLAIHPGTRLALERERIALSPAVRLIDPQGYRTSLTLQLHAAAVLTDSGGVQREAAWLGVPCLVLRGTTEWVEAVAGSGGRMRVVGLDADVAARALAELAPPDRAANLARARAAAFDLAPAGAAAAIVAALEAVR